jgi:hypothetical protein
VSVRTVLPSEILRTHCTDVIFEGHQESILTSNNSWVQHCAALYNNNIVEDSGISDMLVRSIPFSRFCMCNAEIYIPKLVLRMITSKIYEERSK